MSDIAFTPYQAKTKKTSSKLIKILVVVFCLLLVIEGFLYFCFLPSLTQPKIVWKGLSSTTESQMRALLGEVQFQRWVDFDKEKAASLLSTAPYVEEVEVTKIFPKRVNIKITERKPVAMAFVSQGDKTLSVQIDKKGVIFQQTALTDNELPLISGIPVENIPEGMRIPSKYLSLIEQIDSIRTLDQNYFSAISEIHVVPKEFGNYELVLYPVHSRIRILTDRSLSEDSLRNMILMLDVVNTLELKVSEIDLRYGAVSYRTK